MAITSAERRLSLLRDITQETIHKKTSRISRADLSVSQRTTRVSSNCPKPGSPIAKEEAAFDSILNLVEHDAAHNFILESRSEKPKEVEHGIIFKYGDDTISLQESQAVFLNDAEPEASSTDSSSEESRYPV